MSQCEVKISRVAYFFDERLLFMATLKKVRSDMKYFLGTILAHAL